LRSKSAVLRQKSPVFGGFAALCAHWFNFQVIHFMMFALDLVPKKPVKVGARCFGPVVCALLVDLSLDYCAPGDRYFMQRVKVVLAAVLGRGRGCPTFAEGR
jgi:hypothetical protein